MNRILPVAAVAAALTLTSTQSAWAPGKSAAAKTAKPGTSTIVALVLVTEMSAAHRTAPGMPPTDGWKKPHDDSYLRSAREKAERSAK